MYFKASLLGACLLVVILLSWSIAHFIDVDGISLCSFGWNLPQNPFCLKKLTPWLGFWYIFV